MRFVIADDSGIARGILRGAVVVDCGYEVVGEARNGQEAVDLCDRLHPDVVILDVNMPPLNGDQAAAIIEKRKSAGRIIIASLAQQSLPRFREMGYGTLAKPFKREQLGREIRGILE